MTSTPLTTLELFRSGNKNASLLLSKDLTDENSAVGYDVFLVAGQSNAVGLGIPLTKQDFSSENIYQLVLSANSDNGKIIPATPQLYNYDGEGNFVGFPLSFAREYYKKYKRKVLLVPCAKGGTSVQSDWSVPNGTLVTLTTRIMNEILLDSNNIFKGILWHQGESDIGLGINYRNNLDSLVNHFRTNILGASQTPFICGTLSPDFVEDPPEEKAVKIPINTAIQNISQRLNLTDAVNSVGLKGNSASDKIHFSAQALRDLGKRYFQKFEKIKGERKPLFLFPLRGTYNDLYGGYVIEKREGAFVNDIEKGLCLELNQTEATNNWLRTNCGVTSNSYSYGMWVKVFIFNSINFLFSTSSRPYNFLSIQQTNFDGTTGTFNLKHVIEQRDFQNIQYNDLNIFPTNQWIHVAATYDRGSGRIQMFKNGGLVLSVINSQITDYYDNGFIRLGTDNGESWNCLKGRMKDAFYSDYAMNQSEVIKYMML